MPAMLQSRISCAGWLHCPLEIGSAVLLVIDTRARFQPPEPVHKTVICVKQQLNHCSSAWCLWAPPLTLCTLCTACPEELPPCSCAFWRVRGRLVTHRVQAPQRTDGGGCLWLAGSCVARASASAVQFEAAEMSHGHHGHDDHAAATAKGEVSPQRGGGGWQAPGCQDTHMSRRL
jgi:hypothetical protein